MASSVTTALSRPPPEMVRGQAFDVGPRYYGLNYIGEGAYGMVWYVNVPISIVTFVEYLSQLDVAIGT